MSTVDLARTLSQTSLFQGLPIAELDAILTRHYFPISTYDQGQRVAFRGDPYEELSIVLHGAVVAEINDIEGHTLTVETLTAPQVVASAVFFSSNRRFPVDLFAKTETALARIPRAELVALLRRHEEMLDGLLTDMGDRLQFLAQRLRMSQFGSIRKKLALYLLDHIRRGSSEPHAVPNTRQELADIFGVARPSVSRVVSELEEEGVVTTHGRQFAVVDWVALYELAHGLEPTELEPGD